MHQRFVPGLSDSVMYHYDALGRVDTITQANPEYPTTGTAVVLTTFVYDSVTIGTAVSAGGAWCSRLKESRDVLGELTKSRYTTSSGAGQCLPNQIVGTATDTTIFTYGTLSPGVASATRPISVRDPNGQFTNVSYDATTWNSKTTVRVADDATSTAHYDLFGRIDSVIDPVGGRTEIWRDFTGRVTHAKAGTGTLAPVTRNSYDAAGRLTQTEVYSASDTELNTPSGTIQTTKYYYDALGQLDSLVSPGVRGGANTARKQSWLRDRRGNPIYEFPGNGSYVARLYDGLGRLKFQDQSQVSTVMSADGEPFAATSTETFYEGLNLSMGPNLSAGQQKHFYYDAAGNLIGTTMSDNYLGSTAYVTHSYEYDGQGKVVGEGTAFADGVSVTRSYEYNRRGQRTQVADTVSLTGGGSVGDGANGLITYHYDATTGRPDSLVGWSGLTRIGRIRWGYDFGGRQTDRWVKIGTTGKEVHTKTKYDPQGRVDSIGTVETLAGKVWYRFSNPTYSALDELTYLSAAQGQSTGSSSYTQTFSYAVDGTRRLLNSQRNSFNTAGHGYSYDVFGNRLTEVNTTTFTGDCDGTSSTTYGVDNRLNTTTGVPGASPCGEDQIYYHDQAGNRLAVETKRGGVQQRVQKMSYTAARQLYFSLTHTYVPANYDVNWHWYDAGGKRVITHRTTTGTWSPQYDPDIGTTTYYVYDGADVALTVTRIGTSVWAVPQRFLVGGVDQPLLGRFKNTNLGTHQNLALIGDRQGSTVAAVMISGLMETQSTYFSTDAFGAGDAGGALPGGVATGTGYTGASTPNANGGFVYLRNRWYDPQTGRFLTQDPIGLAGGVNLYAYAGNNPVAFTDPFGLRRCEWHDIECWEDKMWAASKGTGFMGRVIAPAVSTLLEFTGISVVDKEAKAAAQGGKLAMAALVLDIGASAIPGGRQGKEATRRLIKSATENPGAWRTVAAFVEKAVSRQARGGVSIQQVVQNEAGDQLVRHTILDAAGEVVEDHYRTMLKAPVK